MRSKFLVCIAVFFLFQVVCAGQAYPLSGQYKPQYARFDQQLIHMLKTWHIPGATVAVIKGHYLSYLRGFGWADVAAHKPMQPDSMFRIASVSKTITATAILRLAQQGKLHLQNSVYRLLGLKPLPGRSVNQRVYGITVADLLHMSSGWAHWFDPMFGPWPDHYVKQLGQQPPVSCTTAARFMLSQPLVYRPGTQFHYANINYCLLGLLVGKLGSGQASQVGYVHYVYENLLRPIGIHGVYIANTRLGQQPVGEVHYYPTQPVRHHYPANRDMHVLWDLPYGHDQILQKNFANGGWVANAFDLAKFFNRLQRGQLINWHWLDVMTRMPHGYRYTLGLRLSYLPYPYGMGWFLLRDGRRTIWYTHGSFTGSNAFVMRLPNGTIDVALFNQKPSSYAQVTVFRHQLMHVFLKYAD